MTFLPTSQRPRLLPSLTVGALCALTSPVIADQVITDDLIVLFSLCVGNDCVNGESFDFDTLRFKENNLRIHFDDTSNSDSFPRNDWRFKFNDTGDGGGNFFAVEDSSAGRDIMTVSAGAPTNSLVVDSNGDVGIGTRTAVLKLHVTDGNSPGLRLEQDGSDGFAPQVWDIAGNETNFFIRNFTNGQQLPFRLFPNTPSGMLVVEPDGVGIATNNGLGSVDVQAALDVNGDALIRTDLEVRGLLGVGTDAPEQLIHIRSNTPNTDAFALFDANAAGSDAAFLLRQNGTVPTTWEFRNQQGSGRLNVGIAGGNTPLKIDNLAANNLLKLGINGNPSAVVVTGQLLVNNTQLNVPDYVFGADYALRPLSEVQAFIDTNSHLPDVPSEAEIRANGVDMTQMQMVLLKKVEELTLYTLEQEAARLEQVALINELRAVQMAQAETIRALQTRLAD